MRPIFITKLPVNVNVEQYEQITKNLDLKLGKDYYVIVVLTNNKEFSFECFNHDLPTIEIEKLKETVLSEIRK